MAAGRRWWCTAVGVAALASVAAAQEAIPPVSQVWVDRQFQTDSGTGLPVDAADEAVDVVFFQWDPPGTVDDRRWVYATGYVTESNGATRFLTMKYNADWPEFSVDPLIPVPRREWPLLAPSSGQVNKAIAMAVDHAGNVYIAGESTDQDAGQSGVDYVLLKYDKDLNQSLGGAPTWQYRYDGPAHGNDRPTDIIVDSQQVGVVFVTGTSWNGTDNDIVTIALDASDGTPCPLWPASTGESTGVRRFNAGGEDLGVELAGPNIACESQGAGNCSDMNCTLQVGVLGTSWDPTTQTFDMLTFLYGDRPDLLQKGVVVWQQRWMGGGDQSEYATGLVYDGIHLVSLGYGPPLTGSSLLGGGSFSSFSSGPSEPNHDYHFVMYDYAAGTIRWNDTVDLNGAPDYSTDLQVATVPESSDHLFWGTGRATAGAAFDAGTVQWRWHPGGFGVPESLTRNWVGLYDVLLARDDRAANTALEVGDEVVVAYLTGSTRGGSVTNDDVLTFKYPQTPAAPSRPPAWTILHAGTSGGEDAGRAIAVGNQSPVLAKSSTYTVGKSFKTGQGPDFIVIRHKQN